MASSTRLEADRQPQSGDRVGRVAIQPWTPGAPQAPGMWLQVELPQPLTVTEMQFESAPRRRGGRAGGGGRADPHGNPGGTWRARSGTGAATARRLSPRVRRPGVDGRHELGTAVAKGQGTGSSTSVTFAPVRAKFVNITQTASAPDAPPWSVLRLRLFEASGNGPSQ